MKINNCICLLFLTGFVFLNACKSGAQSQKSHKLKDGEYEEDLAVFRPKYTAKSDSNPENSKDTDTGKTTAAVTPSKDVTKTLNSKIDTLSHKNAGVKTTQGYRVLIYSGKSSEDVKKARAKVYEILPNADIYTDFKSPNQRVKVGDCIDRVEVNTLFGKLKKAFPNAVVIPDNIVIKAK